MTSWASSVTGLSSFPGFAELKRSLRERPRLRSFGVKPGTAGVEENWHAGSRTDARSLRDLNRLWLRPVK
jgi:hypothetical protein